MRTEHEINEELSNRATVAIMDVVEAAMSSRRAAGVVAERDGEEAADMGMAVTAGLNIAVALMVDPDARTLMAHGAISETAQLGGEIAERLSGAMENLSVIVGDGSEDEQAARLIALVGDLAEGVGEDPFARIAEMATATAAEAMANGDA
jgi:hypothetical protein